MKIFAAMMNLLKNPKRLLKILLSVQALMTTSVASKTALLKSSKDDLGLLLSPKSLNEEKTMISSVVLTTNVLRTPLGFSWMALPIFGDDAMMRLLKDPPESWS